MGFPRGSADKESACNAGDLGSIPGLGRSPGEGKGHSLQYSSLENSMNSILHGVTESWTQLNDFQFISICHEWRVFKKYSNIYVLIPALQIDSSAQFF